MGRVLHASKSGAFPFCLDFPQTNLYGQYGYIQEQLTIQQAMYSYWVPKTWEIVVSIQSSDDSESPFEGGNSFNFSYQIDSEEGFVCNPLFQNPSPLGWANEDFKFFNANFLGSKSMKFSNPEAKNIFDTLYSPHIDGTFSVNAEANDDFIWVGQAIESSGYAPTGTAVVPMGNFEITIPYVILSQADPLGSFYQIYTDFIIGISEYWSYEGTWDTSTGQRL